MPYGNNLVAKVRAIDGKVVRNFTVGNAPIMSAFDGANVWVTNGGDGTVTKLRASDGKVLGTFNLGGAFAIAFDGTYMWVTSRDTARIFKVQLSDGTVVGTFTVPVDPYGIAFDGQNIWVAGAAAVTELRASDGQIVDQFYYQGNASTGIAFDGANIWVSWLNADLVGKL